MAPCVRRVAAHEGDRIRLALGAGRGRVIRSIVREGVIVALAGAAAGVLLAIGASRVLSHLLYRIGRS